MKYAPGSFTKNFAWHGMGLRKLHTAIRHGFHDTLTPVARQRFRDDSGLDASLSLIPINFFLHNLSGQISVDELVFQAVERPHSIHFDRLGLFALHLNRAGTGPRIVERPAMWANEFVRYQLWSGGVWQSSMLRDVSLDSFISDRMSAFSEVRIKCRNNYRHLFELCEFWPSSLRIINTQADQWIASALFLAWDRHVLQGAPRSKSSLLALIDTEELYKLLGVTRVYALAQAQELAELYNSVGGLNRFHYAKKISASTAPSSPTSTHELAEESGLEWLDQEKSDESVERRLVERHEQKRDRKKAAAIKQHYDNTCMFCGIKLQVAEDCFYSEAAHIKGIGEPHNGPDKASNMLVLCPNHHLQFDRGILRLKKVGSHYCIVSKAGGDLLHGKSVVITHNVDGKFVLYHYNWFKSERT